MSTANLKAYAEANNFNTLLVKYYAKQTNNGFVINGKWCGLNAWGQVSFKVADLGDEITLTSQSEGTTENYMIFEFENNSIFVSDFSGSVSKGEYTVGDVTDTMFLFSSAAYQPSITMSTANLKAYAQANNFNTLVIKAYAKQTNNGFIINGQWCGLNAWCQVSFSIADLGDEITLWSQSEGTTENYMIFEFENNL